MLATRLILKNWRNFRDVDVPLTESTYLLGPNASGKSNFLDVFRFLRDISKAQGGGLQKAVADRGGISKLRCLHARARPDVYVEVHLSEGSENWRYILSFRHENRGARRILISAEEVWHDGKCLVARPIDEDKKDDTRLTQTHLEQIQTNQKFRLVADFFSDITYLHLVPQLLKFGDKIGGTRLEDDPFGQGFLERVAKATAKSRDSKLSKIGKALKLAVPQFEQLGFEKDDVTGRPHLKARYAHHRPHAGWQREDQFSDGTLRLLGLLWSLLESNSLLLLEEPELSLNDAIVKQIPQMIQRVQRQSKKRRQLIISTHSEALLSNPGIDAKGVLVIVPDQNGSTIRGPNQLETESIKSGFSIAETILPSTRPKSAEQLGLW